MCDQIKLFIVQRGEVDHGNVQDSKVHSEFSGHASIVLEHLRADVDDGYLCSCSSVEWALSPATSGQAQYFPPSNVPAEPTSCIEDFEGLAQLRCEHRCRQKVLVFGHSIVGASIDGFDGVVEGWFQVAVSIAGGLLLVAMDYWRFQRTIRVEIFVMLVRHNWTNPIILTLDFVIEQEHRTESATKSSEQDSLLARDTRTR